MDIFLALIVAVGGVAAAGLIISGYINNVLSLRDNVNRALGRTPQPATKEQFEEVQRTLDEIKRTIAASPQGAADIGTDELAKAAGPDTEARLKEALELQAQNQEREAIDALYEAFRRDLEPRAKAQLHILIGNSFLRLSELQEAEGHYRQALDAGRAANSREGEANSLGSLGLVYADQSDLERAQEHLQLALAIHKEIGDRPGEAKDLGNLGNIYFDQGGLKRAEEHFKRSLAIHRETGDRLGEASQLGNLGLLAAKRLRRDDACQLLKEAAAMYEEIGAGGPGPDEVRDALQKLGCE